MSSEESERQRRLGHCSRQKVTHAHSAQLESDKDTEKPSNQTKNKNKAIEELNTKVDALTKLMEAITAYKTPEQTCQCIQTHQKPRQTTKQYGCLKCVEGGASSCNHCFTCGKAGHRAVGCLKRGPARNASQLATEAHSLSAVDSSAM